MKRFIGLFIFLTLFSSFVIGADIPCHGKIVYLMADHSGCTDSNGKRQLAFTTNSANNPWMCARTDLGSAMLLAAKAADRKVDVKISDQGQGYTCSNLPQYSKVSYIVLTD